jgi:hypothetical protein
MIKTLRCHVAAIGEPLGNTDSKIYNFISFYNIVLFYFLSIVRNPLVIFDISLTTSKLNSFFDFSISGVSFTFCHLNFYLLPFALKQQAKILKLKTTFASLILAISSLKIKCNCMRRSLFVLLFLIVIVGVKGDEGMWMLPLIKQHNIQKMHNMGCALPAEDIYSDSLVSMKDAIVVFGGGCTGVVVSNQGLVFTNHHCGYGAIQKLSTVEHNYLKNGFTAQTLRDELPVPGLTVKFLVSMTDVTERVLKLLPDSLDFNDRAAKQDSVLQIIREEYSKDNDYIVQTKSFYSNNEFYVFVLEEFKDIRLAYTPPSSIGKFGGDTDNWMWPRHTGDFAVFRIYADSLGKPAAFQADNIPYTPQKVIPIASQGYQENDFVMILGNPGSTSRYLTSFGIHNRIHAANQSRIDVRGAKQAVWESFMQADEAIHIAYAGKYAGSSNYWKNSIGMNKAVEKLRILDRKREVEKAFEKQIETMPPYAEKYGNVLPALKRNYELTFPLELTSSYLREALILGVEMPRMAAELKNLVNSNLPIDSIRHQSKEIYKDYVPEVDEATFAVMLQTYRQYVDKKYLPSIYALIDKKFKGDYQRYAHHVYSQSSFTSHDKFCKRLKAKRINLTKDPALQFRAAVDKTLNALNSQAYHVSLDSIQHLNRLFEAGLKTMNLIDLNEAYPDANFTMRMTYGTISGYQPADAVTYNYFTTAEGVLEKEIPNDREFHVPEKLKTAIRQQDFGAYADKTSGKLFVNFLCNTDITGGNSGSPVFNAHGELLGLAFDGNWEAMSGDIIFESELQRTIAVDVRYMLFIMEKIGGAESLVQELRTKSEERRTNQ